MAASLALVFSSAKNEDAEQTLEFALEFGGKGDAEGQFNSPIGIAISKDDRIYVTDLNNARIQSFDTDGKFLGQFSLPNDVDGLKHSQAPGIAIADDGLLYVSFMLQHQIGVYSAAGELLQQWGVEGDAPGQLNGPGGLVLDKQKRIYVADQRNHRVQVFSLTGEFIQGFGSHGSDAGQFGGNEPKGSRFGGPHFLAIDSLDRIFTTEGTLARVQRFDSQGHNESTWGNGSDAPGGFGALKTAFSENTFGPIAVMLDSQDRVWVSSLNDRVQAFSTDGKFLFGTGARGNGPGQFFRPHGMAMDSKGNLYVCDSSNHRIQKFRVVLKSKAE